MKRLIGEAFRLVWWLAYGRWTGWAWSRIYDKMRGGHCVGLLAMRAKEGGQKRWFWRRGVDGMETLL